MSFLDALLGRKHPPMIGLDISSSSVKLVELGQTGSGEYVAANDAVLLAHAPVMLDALYHVASVLAAMAGVDPGPSGLLAPETHDKVEKLLRGPLFAHGLVISSRSVRASRVLSCVRSQNCRTSHAGILQ